MIRMILAVVLIGMLFSPARAYAQVDDVILEFQSGSMLSIDDVTCTDGILTSRRVRYVGEWNKTRVVDTLHFSLDSVRVVTLDEGSTVLGTFLPVSLGSVLLGLVVGAGTGGLGGAVAFLGIAGLGTAAGLITGLASASEPELYTPALPHDAAAVEGRISEEAASDRVWGAESEFPSARDLIRQLEFVMKDGQVFDGRLLDVADGEAVILIDEVTYGAIGQPHDIVTLPLSTLSTVRCYGNSGTAPWGTLLLGGGGLLALTLATNASDGELAQNALLTVGPGLVLDIIMGIRAASPSWQWNPALDSPAELREASLEYVLENRASKVIE